MALVITRGGYVWALAPYFEGEPVVTVKNTGSVAVNIDTVRVRCAKSVAATYGAHASDPGYYSHPPSAYGYGTGANMQVRLKSGSNVSSTVTITNNMQHKPWVYSGDGQTYYTGTIENSGVGVLYTFTFSTPVRIAAGAQAAFEFEHVSGANVIGVWYHSADGDEDIIPPSNYTVTFDLDGGTRTGGGALTQTVTAGSSATAPTCTKTGYTLSGWDKPLSPINANTTIKAVWTVNKLSIVYNANGGTIANPPYGPSYSFYYKLNGSTVERSSSASSGFASPFHIVEYGGTVDLVNIASMGMTRPGYSPVPGAQWRTSATGGTSFNQDTVYPVSGTTGLPDISSGSKTLTVYANWQKQNYSITLNGNGGSFATATGWTISGDTATKSVPYQDAPGTPPTLSKSITLTYDANGGTFNGTNTSTSTKTLNLSHTWNTKADGTGTSYTDAQLSSLSITDSITLYAIYTKAAVGTLPTVGTGTSQIKARDGYRLDTSTPWTTSKNGSTAVTSSSAFNVDTTIWAKWEYRVTLDANGGMITMQTADGSVVTSDTKWKKHGTALSMDYLISKLGGILIGISTNSSAATGVGTVTQSGDKYRLVYSYSSNAPATYYAIYKPETMTVTFKDGYSPPGHDVLAVISDVEYGTSVAEQHVPKVGNIYNGKVFKKPGPWGFMGWSGSYENITEDTTCVAMWEFCVVWIVVEKDGQRTWVPYKPDPDEPDNN